VRIRQVKPAFWSDAKLADLPEPTRLFYIGLWMLADDAGWMRWDATEAAKDLYGFEGRARRERRVSQMFDQLVAAGRVIPHVCGHAYIPTMASHQRLSGMTKQVHTYLSEHQRQCIPAGGPPLPAGTRETPPVPARNGKGTEREREQELERSGTFGNGSAPAGASLKEKAGWRGAP
jgi:hypothetical protein